MLVEVPERIQPVCMVQVGIAAEHLLHDALAVLVECLGEAAGLSNPLIRRRAVRACWGGGVGGSGGGWSSRGTDGVSHRGGLRNAIHLLGGEHDWVMDLADDPLLDSVDELRGGNLGGAAVHEPSVGQAIETIAVSPQLRLISMYPAKSTYRPADIVGHVFSLQIGRPVTPFVSWMTWSMP